MYAKLCQIISVHRTFTHSRNINMLRVTHISQNTERILTPNDFQDSELHLIAGITASNLKSATSLAEISRKAGSVTVGIPSEEIPSSNEDMQKFIDMADAVIITQKNTEHVTRKIIEVIENLITKSGFVNLDIADVRECFRNAGTVYFGVGIASDCVSAANDALKMSGSIEGAKYILLNIIASPNIALSEMVDTTVIFKSADPEANIVWGHTIDEGMNDNAEVMFFAAMNDNGYRSYSEIIRNEPPENISAMLEGGIDERTELRLGTRKDFFKACLTCGTSELAKTFIAHGYDPKELEVDGAFPNDILSECVRTDYEAGNTEMLELLFGAGISLDGNCIKALQTLEMKGKAMQKIIQAFIDYGMDINSHNKDNENETLLHIASAHGSYEFVKILVDAGADVNVRDYDDNTPLMVINYGRNKSTAHEILKCLLVHGADVNASDIMGRTAMFKDSSYMYCFPDIVKTLIDAGADVNKKVNGESVLGRMFFYADRSKSRPAKQTFLREVLPMMLNAGAEISCPAPFSAVPADDRLASLHRLRAWHKRQAKAEAEYEAFRSDWKNLLTEEYAARSRNFVVRLLRNAIESYDVKTVKGILECFTPDESILEELRGLNISFRINDFPEAEIENSSETAEIKRRLEAGAEILKILNDGGINFPLQSPSGTELSYIVLEDADFDSYLLNRVEFPCESTELTLCHSPESLRKATAQGVKKDDGEFALKVITGSFADYYNAAEMARLLIAKGADIKCLSHTRLLQCIFYRGERLMLKDIRQIKIIAMLLWLRNVKKIRLSMKNPQYHFADWDDDFGGPLSCNLLSHLWEMIETGTDYKQDWVSYNKKIMMLISACWGSVKDIEKAISNGGDVNAKTWLGYTPLMYASFFNSAEAVKCLINNGADISARSLMNQNAVMIAVMSDYTGHDPKVIRVLAEAGVDIKSDSLMEMALNCCNIGAVGILLMLGLSML